MEMHSYAKTRTNKKWTIEHKRKLVDNRITLDVLFNKKAYNLVDSWKKLTKVSDMESFDVLFVRKQWTNILTKYKNLVQRHSINNHVDNETLDLLTAEWEFFDKIHRWVKVKEKNQNDFKNIILEEIENETVSQSIVGSDINTSNIAKNNKQKELQNNFNRISSDDEEPIVVLDVGCTTSSLASNKNKFFPLRKSKKPLNNLNDEQVSKVLVEKIPICLTNVTQHSVDKIALEDDPLSSAVLKTKENKPSHRRKSSVTESKRHLYNKTKRKYRKMEKQLKRLRHGYSSYKSSTKKLTKKLNAFCDIFAKVIKEEYPNVNVSNLLEDDETDITTSNSNSDSD